MASLTMVFTNYPNISLAGGNEIELILLTPALLARRFKEGLFTLNALTIHLSLLGSTYL